MAALNLGMIPEDLQSVVRFCNQFLQLERGLDYPGSRLLREEHVQAFLFNRLFSDGAVPYPPPPRYQLRVLKELMPRIESSIEDWEQHVSLSWMASPNLSSMVSATMVNRTSQSDSIL